MNQGNANENYDFEDRSFKDPVSENTEPFMKVALESFDLDSLIRRLVLTEEEVPKAVKFVVNSRFNYLDESNEYKETFDKMLNNGQIILMFTPFEENLFHRNYNSMVLSMTMNHFKMVKYYGKNIEFLVEKDFFNFVGERDPTTEEFEERLSYSRKYFEMFEYKMREVQIYQNEF